MGCAADGGGVRGEDDPHTRPGRYPSCLAVSGSQLVSASEVAGCSWLVDQNFEAHGCSWLVDEKHMDAGCGSAGVSRSHTSV